MYSTAFHNEDLSNYNFLVTGGAGFIGSNIVEYLLQFGAKKVRILDNFSTGSRQNIEVFKDYPALEIIEGDIRNIDNCKKAIEEIDFVTHQAALGSVPRSINDPITTNDVNVSGFLNMLVAVYQHAGIKRFVYAASSSTYGDNTGLPKVEENIGNPLSPYAVTKYVNELYAGVFSKTYNLHTIGLRYFNVFGPKQNLKGPYAAAIPLFIHAALNNTSPTIYGDGETSRDFTFVENAVQANIRAMFTTVDKHHVLNIAFGERTSLNQLWQDINAIAGSGIAANYGEARAGDIKHTLASIDKAKKVIGYQPLVNMYDGLKVAYDWYKSNK